MAPLKTALLKMRLGIQCPFWTHRGGARHWFEHAKGLRPSIPVEQRWEEDSGGGFAPPAVPPPVGHKTEPSPFPSNGRTTVPNQAIWDDIVADMATHGVPSSAVQTRAWWKTEKLAFHREMA